MNRSSVRLVAIGSLVLLAVVIIFAFPSGSDGEAQLPIGQFGGAVGAAAASGSTAWLGAGSRLEAVDIADPGAPRRIWHSSPIAAPIRSIAASPDVVLAAAGTEGLLIFDPARLEDAPLATVATSWSVNDVDLQANIAYMAEGARGLRAVDTSSARAPTELGQVDTPGDALAVAVGRETAFVADWGTGVRVFDIADPAAMTEIAHIDTPGEAVDVALDGSLLLVADRIGGLLLVDVTDPASPRQVGELEIGGRAESVEAAGGVAYVAAPDSGLSAVDISDPSSPRIVAQLSGAEAVVDVALLHEPGAGTGSPGEPLVLASDVGAPIQLGSAPAEDLWSRMHIWGIEGPPLVAKGLAGVHLARGPALERVGMIVSPSLIEGGDADEEEQLLYLADGQAGLLVVDVADPVAPTMVSGIGMKGVAHDAVLEGELLVVAAGPAGAHVLDTSDPRAPTELFTHETDGETMGVLVDDGTVYVADGPGGLVAFDVESRERIGHLPLPGYAWDVTRAGEDLVFVSARDGGLLVVDVAKPERPTVVATVLEGTDVLDAQLDGDRLWVAAGPAGVYVYDAADPRALREIARGIVDDRAIGVVPSGDDVYVAAGRGGVAHFRMEGADLVEQGSWSLGGVAERMVRLGEEMYVAAEIGGLQVLALDD